LRPRGRLVIPVPAANDDGTSGFEDLLDHVNATLAEMVDEGAVTADERARMVLGAWPRRRCDLLAPFGGDGQFCDLKVEYWETNVVADAAWATMNGTETSRCGRGGRGSRGRQSAPGRRPRRKTIDLSPIGRCPPGGEGSASATGLDGPPQTLRAAGTNDGARCTLCCLRGRWPASVRRLARQRGAHHVADQYPAIIRSGRE
jgi:hypothetical protein